MLVYTQLYPRQEESLSLSGSEPTFHQTVGARRANETPQGIALMFGTAVVLVDAEKPHVSGAAVSSTAREPAQRRSDTIATIGMKGQ
jgi:hypothetical protein